MYLPQLTALQFLRSNPRPRTSQAMACHLPRSKRKQPRASNSIHLSKSSTNVSASLLKSWKVRNPGLIFFRQALLDLELATSLKHWKCFLLQYRQRPHLYAVQLRFRTSESCKCAPLLPRTLQTSLVESLLRKHKDLPFFSSHKWRCKTD